MLICKLEIRRIYTLQKHFINIETCITVDKYQMIFYNYNFKSRTILNSGFTRCSWNRACHVFIFRNKMKNA